MVVVPVEPIADEAREAIVDGLAQAIKAGTETGIVVEVLLVDRYAEAMAALCDSGSGLVSIAWLDGVTFAAAQAQNCGQAALQVRRGTGRDLQTALAGQIILSGELGTTDLDAVRGRNFCRLGLEDFYSWFVPWLVFKTQGIDLLNDADAVVDHGDLDSLVAAVASGECAAAGIAEDALSALLEDDEDLADQIEIVETTTPFPFAILLYPLEVQLGVRLDLNDVLIAISENEETEELLRAILGQDSLTRTTPDDFADLLAFMNETGLDLAQLGN
jgi:ABC-type phosphate/phosphonate transport system substrate-binding protein